MRPRSMITLLACTLSLAVTGCAKPRTVPPTAAGLSAEEARAFDHGVDFVAALGGLEGKWRTDYDADLDLRTGSADLVALMTVETVHSDTDPEQRINHRLVGPVSRVIFGEEVKELSLVSREADEGYDTVHEGLTRVQNQPFVVYGRWFRGESGRKELHFHLSPATDEIVAQTESRVGLREGSSKNTAGEQVIVTNH